jgi:hypothetical protein
VRRTAAALAGAEPSHAIYHLTVAEHGVSEPADSDAQSLQLAAAGLGADRRDLEALMRALAEALKGGVGVHIDTEHVRGGWRRFIGDLPFLDARTGQVRAIEVTVGQRLFRITAKESPPCHIGTVSATGVPADLEAVSVSVWARQLLDDLDRQATVTEGVRHALEALIIG